MFGYATYLSMIIIPWFEEQGGETYGRKRKNPRPNGQGKKRRDTSMGKWNILAVLKKNSSKRLAVYKGRFKRTT